MTEFSSFEIQIYYNYNAKEKDGEVSESKLVEVMM